MIKSTGTASQRTSPAGAVQLRLFDPPPAPSGGHAPAPPTPAAQALLLRRLRAGLEPLLAAERLTMPFDLLPGTRLRRAYGRCTYRGDGQPPSIAVRCTADHDPHAWRRTGAIIGTLLHEVAHLRYRSHGPRFWTLHRRLVDRAVAAHIYDPTDRDPAERGRGDEKLAASAAHVIAFAARQARLARARTTRRTRELAGRTRTHGR